MNTISQSILFNHLLYSIFYIRYKFFVQFSCLNFVRPISSKHFLYNNYLFVQFSCLNLFRPVSFYIITISFIQIIITIFFLFFLIFFSFPPPPPQPMDYNPLRGLQPIPNPHPQPTPNPPNPYGHGYSPLRGL